MIEIEGEGYTENTAIRTKIVDKRYVMVHTQVGNSISEQAEIYLTPDKVKALIQDLESSLNTIESYKAK